MPMNDLHLELYRVQVPRAMTDFAFGLKLSTSQSTSGCLMNKSSSK